MSNILSQAQALIATLKTLMPSIYQQDSLQALLGLLLESRGIHFLNIARSSQLVLEPVFE